MSGGWIALVRSLGEALLSVLRAELAALQADLSKSGRHFGLALALFGGAAAIGFWVVGLAVFALVSLAALWLPLWAAALAVLALFAGGAALLVQLGRSRLEQVENPIESVRRRVDDHLDWWQSRLLATGEDEEEEDEEDHR